MAENTLGRNQVFAIKNADGTPFHDLVLHKATYDSVVMSLGDKITGDVYYKDNGLNVTMLEYIEYDGVKYILVAPPTIVRNGIVSDNSELKGMTKYSFTFYHPMYQLSNLPFSDVAVTEDSKRYLSENKVFSWIGYPNDFIAKIDKNLEGTQWMCVRSSSFPTEKDTMLSEVLSFSKNTIADALKAWYDTWDIPYVIERVNAGESGYSSGKRFKVIMGLPSSEIYEYVNGHATQNKFVFRMGQGLGLKNNSLTPRNNKIVTRISGCGSEDNIPYGYPQIIWYGEQGREFTYGDSVGTYTNVTIGGHTYPKIVSYPIYKGIVGGMYVELIQHPFTRTNLMPSVYRTTLFNKISFLNPNGTPNTNYNPDITLVDSYDAIPTSQYPYVNAINPDAPSYEYHEFEEVKPELGEESITGVTPINNDLTPASSWDDTMNDDGEYVQSYFKITLPVLSFDIYACAAITQEMQINMRSGACLGCTFPVQVDWEAYKASFYDEEGEFSPSGSQRDYEKFPDSSQESISLILQKEFATFGTLMPNVYQNPHAGDLFVVLGISLPESYITNAEGRLVTEMKSYMLLNNVHYYDYPLKFDEYFLANNTDILRQIRPNSIVRFKFNNETLQLYVKQLAIKFEEATLPQYDITLTDNIDVVTNPIGRVSDSVDKLATIIALTKQGLKYGGEGKGSDGLSRTHDDTAAGVITFLKGINIGRDFISGILGEGGVFRKEADGKTYLETDSLYVRMKAYFDTVEIKKYEHSSGNRTASNAGFKTVRVVPFGYYQGEFVPLGEDHKYHWTTTEIDTETGQEVIVEHKSDVLDTQFYRCYYRATDGDDTVTNDFRVGDLAFVREINTDTINQHHLWRVVIGKDNGSNITEDGEGWIDLSNRSSEQFTITTIEDGQSVNHNFFVKGYEYGSDAPLAQDDIVQLGNVNNAERQGAIVEYVNGANSPSYQIYQKIGEVDYLDGQTIHDPYVLADKNMIAIGYNSATGKAYINVYGDAFIGAKDNSTYVKYDSGQKKLTIKAALDVNSTVDGKTIGSYFESLDDVHRVFSSELGNLDANGYPKPPYSQGDIWVNAVYPSSDVTVGGQVIPRGSIHNNEILVCKTNNDEKTRTVVIDGEETLDYELFSIADWKRASEYQHTFDYLTNALKAMQGSTQITGGLVLSSMIALRDTQQTPNIWSGISGVYDNTLTTGGVAAWYGGNAIDYEALPTPKPDWSQQRYARSLFRFDGSGYVANGNLSWDNTGRLTIRQVYWGNEDLTNFFNAFSVGTEVVGGATRVVITPKGNMALMNVKENGLVIGGSLTYDANGNVTGVNAGTNGEKYAATRGWVSQNYISIEYFNRIFQAYKSSTITDANKVIPNDVQTTINNLKIMVGAWTEQYLSALGNNSSGGEIMLNEPLASINNSGLSAPSSNEDGKTIVWNNTTGKWAYGTAGGSGMTYTFATGDANGQFKVTPSSGSAYNVSIKGLAALAYKASLAVSDIPDLSGKYLPLTGGTLSINGIGGFTVKNTSSNYPLIRFEGNTGGGLGFLGIGKTGNAVNPYYVTADNNGGYTDGVSQWYFLLHSGNYTDYTYSKSYIDTELAKKLDVAFFDALFQAYAGSTKVIPNTSTSSVDNIKAMFGFWTQQYISALGKNDSQGVVSALSDLSDVTITSPSNGQALIYDNGQWRNGEAGMNMSQLTTYLSSKILTVKNGLTTLGTWNPTAAGTIDIASALGAYLPLTGGTLSLNGIGAFTIKNTASDYPLIRFEGNIAGGLGFIGVNAQKQPVFVTVDNNGGYTEGVSQWYALLHTGNWTSTINLTSLGAASSSSVSTLQGYFTNGVANSAARLSGTSSYTAWGRTYWNSGVPQNVSGNIDLNKGEYITLKDGSNYYSIFGVSSYDNTLLIGWELKSITNSDTTLCAGNNLNIGYGSNVGDTTYGKYWSIFRNNGHLTINADDSSDVFLNVGGATKTTRLYLYKPNAANDTNAVYLEYNTNNSGVHLVGGGFYSDTYVSALGVNSSGGGGGSTTLEGLLDVAISNPSNGQVLKYNSTTQKWYNGTDEGATSLAWSAITGKPETATRWPLFSEVTSKPNTISGYGITDAKIQSGTIILGNNSLTPLLVDNVNTLFTSLSSTNETNLSITVGGTTKTVSGLYALRLKSVDIIDNTTGNAYGNLNNLDGSSYSVVTNYHGNGSWSNAPAFGSNYGGAVVIRSTNSYLMGQLAWSAAHDATTYSTQDLWWRARGTGGWKNDWKRFAFRGENQYIDNNNFIYWKNNASSPSDILTIGLSGDNDLVIGYGVAGMGYSTYLDGNNVNIRYGTSRTSGIFLNSSGNVGIGTTSPSYKLDVNDVTRATRLISNSSDGDSLWLISSSTYNCIRFDLGTTFKWSFGCNADYFYWYGASAGYALSLLNNGNFGIGTNSPSYKLDVAGDMGCTGVIFKLKGIELNSKGGLADYGGFIDFHYNGSSADYTSRFIETDYGLMKLMSKNASGGNQRSALVVGEGYDTSYVQIGDIRLVYNYNNNALRVVRYDGSAANFYATGGISALGIIGDASGSVSSSLLPSVSGEYDLGSTSYKWRNLYLYNGGAFSIVPGSSAISLNSNKKIVFTSDIEINDESSLYVDNRICIGSSNSSYAFYVSGNSYLTGSISASNVINRSDMRLKDFVKNTDLRVESIAEAPSFKFTFKDGDGRLQVGTSAQYWRGALPESVLSDADGMLGLDYGVTALVSVISVARKVVTHEEEIAALKRRIGELENEIKTLKAA